MKAVGYLVILGVRFRVVEKRMAGAWGECDIEKARINIKPDLDGGVWWTTLWHEVIHAVEQQLSLGLTEAQVDGLASGFVTSPQVQLKLGRGN